MAWPATPSPLAWTPRKDAPATPWNTRRRRAKAAMLIGPADEALAVIERSASYVTDTMDFWRRPGSHYPRHAERFSGDPGYFGHVVPAAEEMMAEMKTQPADYDHIVVHQPNVKFPAPCPCSASNPNSGRRVLSWPKSATPTPGPPSWALTAILDVAQPGQRAGGQLRQRRQLSDAFQLRITDRILDANARRKRGTTSVGTPVDYTQYARMRGKLAHR
ncbi:MAG: hypothetical protein R2856_09365 [Caldilineaceae bacterium]